MKSQTKPQQLLTEHHDSAKLTEQEMQDFQERQKYEPIYSPRTSLKTLRDQENVLLNEILLKLDAFTLSILKNEFESRGGELQSSEFISMMMIHLSNWNTHITNRLRKLHTCLFALFESIDLNLKGLLNWQDLSNYVMGKAATSNSNNSHNNTDISKQYSLDENFRFNSKVITNIKKILYISDLDKIIYFEEGSDLIQIMNHSTGEISNNPLRVEHEDYVITTTTIKKNTAKGIFFLDEKTTEIKRRTLILDMINISSKKHNYIIVSTTDSFIRAYRTNSLGLKKKSECRFEKELRKEVNCMAWDESTQTLLCGQIDGCIELCDMNLLDKLGATGYKEMLATNPMRSKCVQLFGHTDVVSSVVCFPKVELCASGSLDGKLILWDTIKKQLKTTYSAHTRAITSLAYDPQTILLFSAGLDHWIGVWNPYTDHMVYKIVCGCGLQDIRVIEGGNQLIVLDMKGGVQVRDIQKFEEQQRWNIESFVKPTNFCFLKANSCSKLVIGGQSIVPYRFNQEFNPHITDNEQTINCHFNATTLRCYTPAGNRVKVWCGLTGEVFKIFLSMSHQQSVITAFCIDELEKRMIIGDESGYVSSFNCENGAKILTLPRHNSSVTHILDSIALQVTVTCSSDGTIHISRNTNINPRNQLEILLRSINMSDCIVTAIDLYAFNSSIVVGFASGSVSFLEISSGKLLGEFHEETCSAVTDLISFPQLPFVIVATQDGEVFFVSGPPLLYKWQIVERFSNLFTQQLLSSENNIESEEFVGVVKMKYCQDLKQIFIADSNGYLKCYDVSAITDSLYDNAFNKDSNNQNNQVSLSLRKYNSTVRDSPAKILWQVRVTQEQIHHLGYNNHHKLLFVTTTEKIVSIFSSVTGELLESLRQSEQLSLKKPIGFRLKNTLELYDDQLIQRIDRTQEEEDMIEKQKQKDYLFQLKKNIKQQQKDKKKQETIAGNTITAANEIEEDENEEQYNQNEDEQQISKFPFLQQSLHESSVDTVKQQQNRIIKHRSSNNSQFDGEEHRQHFQKNLFITNNHFNKSLRSSASLVSNNENKNLNNTEDEKEQLPSEDSKGLSSTGKSNTQQVALDDREIFLEYPECEFDAFFFCERVKKEQFRMMKSKPQWRLQIDYKDFWQKRQAVLGDLEKVMVKKEKRAKVMELPQQKFKISHFEVDLEKFNPHNGFQPVFATTKGEQVFQANEDSLDPKSIAKEYIKNLKESKAAEEEQKGQLKQINKDQVNKKDQDKEIQVFKQSYACSNLSKSKTNWRNQDSDAFLKLIQNKVNLSSSEMDKLKGVYLALRETEDYQDTSKTEVLRNNKDLLHKKPKTVVLSKINGKKGKQSPRLGIPAGSQGKEGKGEQNEDKPISNRRKQLMEAQAKEMLEKQKASRAQDQKQINKETSKKVSLRSKNNILISTKDIPARSSYLGKSEETKNPENIQNGVTDGDNENPDLCDSDKDCEEVEVEDNEGDQEEINDNNENEFKEEIIQQFESSISAKENKNNDQIEVSELQKIMQRAFSFDRESPEINIEELVQHFTSQSYHRQQQLKEIRPK